MIKTIRSTSPALDSSPIPTLPIEGSRSQVYSGKRATASLELDPHVSLSTSYGMARLVAAVAAVLARYGGGETISLGLCKKGVVVAISLSAPCEGTLDGIAAQAALLLENTTWDPTSFERQVCAAKLTEVIDRNPLFAVLVVLDELPAPELRQDVTLSFDGGRTLLADYNARVFNVETVGRFLSHLSRILVALQQVRPPALSGARMLDDGEEYELLALASGGIQQFNGTIDELLTSALARSPDVPVVEFGNRSWSLRGLMDRADAIGRVLAPRLQFKGERIGVALCPGCDQIAALIAIIRLSGVIVPLDTTLPALRQEAIRSVAELTAIITEDHLVQHFAGTDPIVMEHLAWAETSAVRPHQPAPATPEDPL